jgi:hypothetical protein
MNNRPDLLTLLCIVSNRPNLDPLDREILIDVEQALEALTASNTILQMVNESRSLEIEQLRAQVQAYEKKLVQAYGEKLEAMEFKRASEYQR